MGQVAYLIISEARVAAALSRPRDRDQLEADALNKYPAMLRLAEAVGVPAERLAGGVDDPAEEMSEPEDEALQGKRGATL
jgi:hypothetical protein